MGKRVNIYLKDQELFKTLQAKIKFLWYVRYGESLSKADILTKAMECLQGELLKDDTTG